MYLGLWLHLLYIVWTFHGIILCLSQHSADCELPLLCWSVSAQDDSPESEPATPIKAPESGSKIPALATQNSSDLLVTSGLCDFDQKVSPAPLSAAQTSTPVETDQQAHQRNGARSFALAMWSMQQAVQTLGCLVPRLWECLDLARPKLQAGCTGATMAILGLAAVIMDYSWTAEKPISKEKKSERTKQWKTDAAKGQGPQGYQRRQRQGKGRQRAKWQTVTTFALMAYACSSASPALCEHYDSFGQSCVSGFPTFRGIAKAERPTQGPEERQHRQRRCGQSSCTSGSISWEGRHAHLQAAGVQPGRRQEGGPGNKRILEELPEVMAAILRRDAEVVGDTCSPLRSWRAAICKGQEGGFATSGRRKAQAESYARENYSHGGRAIRRRRGGRAHGRYARCHHSLQEAQRCHVGGCFDNESQHRGNVTQTKTAKGCSQRGDRAKGDSSPSLGRTARVPSDLQDRPKHCPRRVSWADDFIQCSLYYDYDQDKYDAPVETFYMPHLCWSHSIVLEPDFKSPCTARQQALLLETELENLDNLEFDDTLQGFCLVKPQTTNEEGKAVQLTLADVIPWQDIETFCFEIAFDAEDLQESGLAQLRIDKPFFSLHFSADLLLDDYSFESTREASISLTNWTHLLRQWRIDPPDRSLRLFRVHGGDLARAAGEHHLLITTWQTDQTPGLVCDLRHQKPLFAVKDLAGPWRKDLSCEKPWESRTKLWCRGRPLDDSLPFQCGTAIYATLDLMPTRKARVDENDLAPPPNFDMDIDEMMVLPEDVQGRDDPIVIIRDDEDLILQALTAYEEVGVVNIVMFGFDGESIGRRDREVSPATFEAIQRAIEISWSDYQGHLIKPVLVRPQPPALRGQGLIFVVAIQHIFAGTPTPQPGCSLCLAGIQLSYAGSNEPDVHRAFEIEEDFAVVDIRQRLQLSSLCQPQGRRQCDFALELRALAEDTRYRNRPVSYITADIQLERALFDIARAFRDLDSVIADIDTALQAENIEQIRIVQHGFRFRPLGVVNQLWNNRDPVDPITLSQQFARGWTRHPLDRLKIFRVRALDCVEPAVATLSLHFIMAFDLVPGNAVCLVMKGNEQPWPIAGPHLLQPQFWAADGLDPASENPLTDDNYEIMLYMGRTPTLIATSGDTIVYVDPAGEPDDPPPAESDEVNLLQLHSQDARQDCNFAATNPDLKSNPTFEIPGPASEHGRTLELFPLLWGDCCEVPLPCAKVECQQFLRACQQFPLCQTLPDDFMHHLKPITLAYLDTCTDEIFDRGDLHIYTDGSSYIHREDEYVEREASWAAAVFRVDGTRRCFLGWTAGFVADLPEQRTYIGATARGAMQAERTGIFWIVAWTLGLPAGQNIHLFVDNQPACFGATGHWTFDLADDLACRDRYVFLLASEKHFIRAHHVKSHSAQPMNELVDGIASALPNARHCLAFKNAQIEKTIANFDDFNVLWFHMISSTILPPVHNDRLVLLPVDEDRLFCPKLSRQRDSNWKEADEQQRAHMSISIVTYNVLSLRHCDPSKEVDADSIFPGKTKYIAKQMLEARHHVLTLQECRSSHSGIFENGELIRIVSAGLPQGIYGTEIWLNKSCPLGKIGKNKIGFDRQHLLILHADPRLLVAKIKVADQTVVIISGHCPHSLDTQEVRERWWAQLDDILRRLHTNDLIICGCDFNARMPNARLPHVGDLLCEKGNANTTFLESILGNFNLFLPSTFSELHNGPSETWRHSSGQVARLDYIAVRQASWDTLVSSAWAKIDAGNAIPDHYAVALHATKSWRTCLRHQPRRSIDWEQVRAPENREFVCDLVATIPVAPWSTMPTKQLENLNDSLTAVLQKNFPKQSARPKKPYITQPTWNLRQKRCRILRLLRLIRLEEAWHDMHRAWARLKMQNASPGRLSQTVILTLTTQQALASLRSTARELKSHLRSDKAAFVARIAENACEADSTAVFKALAPLRVGSKFKKRSIEPLPMWKLPSGENASSHEERVNVWRQFCSDLEVGHPVTPQELLHNALDRSAQRRRDLPDLTFAEIPTILQLEDRLRRIKRNKAAGNDGLKSELFTLAAPQLARHLFSLSMKMMVTLHEPLQSKGGTLAAAFKGSGASNQISNYRSLLLSNHFGKALRSHWRQRTMPLYERASSCLHFAGKPGGNVSHASMVLQNLLLGADKRSKSTCTIFLDVSTAYYRVIRELVVHQTTTDEALAQILHRFGLPEEEFARLWRHLQTPDILTSIGTDPRHKAILDELLSSTWFTVMGEPEITATRAGSRPGDNLADVVYAFVYSRLLEHLRLSLEHEGYQTFDAVSLDESLRRLEPCEIDAKEAPQLCDITWADDLAIFLQHGDPHELLRRAKLTAGVMLDLCWSRGLLPNLNKGKTEAILKLKGPNSKQLRLQTFRDPEPALDVPSTLKQDVKIRLVHKYRHLGHQIPLSYKQEDEVRARTGQARAAYAQHRKTIFQNTALPLALRSKLLNCLVISVLSFNQGTWSTLGSKCFQHYAGTIMGFYRGLLRPEIGKDALQSWSDARVLAFIKMPGPQELLHASRLRYLGSMWRSAPLPVWWAVHYGRRWFDGLQQALLWLHNNTKGLDFAAGADWRKDHWEDIVAQPKQWKHYIKKALSHSVEHNAVTEHLYRWHFDFVSRAVDLGLQVDELLVLRSGLSVDAQVEADVHSHACILCQETFSTYSAWAVHANRRHGRIAPERLLLRGTTCEVCRREYHTSRRLFRHLMYSKQCSALLHGQPQMAQAVRPGIGNTHLDKDAPIPLPVCAAELPEERDWSAVEPVELRASYHRDLHQELINDFDLFVAQGALDEEAFLDSCFVKVCETIDSFPSLQNTVDKLHRLFQDDEEQLLHRLPHGALGARLWWQLRLTLEIPRLIPKTSPKCKPHQIRGAAYNGLHLCRFKFLRWSFSLTIPRFRARELVILHLFSGHRRPGDLTSYLQDLPSPDGAVVAMVALDIIFDPVRCDLSRRKIQTQWIGYARCGAVLGFVAGPPCESWSSSRAEGGRAGGHSGDGGPRMIRSWNQPFGLDATTPDEQAHIFLANTLLFFSLEMALELLVWIAFFLLEHPDPPSDARSRDLPTIWETGPVRALRGHPAVHLHEIQQGRFGAKSPKPTTLMSKGLPSLSRHLEAHGTLPLPKALKMGKTEGGQYSTASLKEYPPRLCAAMGDAIRDFLKHLKGYGTDYSLEAPARQAWISEIKKNQNLSAQMGGDRAGAGS